MAAQHPRQPQTSEDSRTNTRRPGGGRVSRSLAALSSAAILSIYAVGYTSTQAAEQQLTAVAAPPPARDTPTSAATPTAARGTTTSPAPSTATDAPRVVTATPISGYRDGTYVGNGTSRHGGIEATVVVSAGKIASVQITQCLTRYPCSWIAGLPGAVVARQSAQVALVSGASDSSRAFIGAVTQALSYAH